jgi:predicted Fe-S protein YdhL (DUF1289 family)
MSDEVTECEKCGCEIDEGETVCIGCARAEYWREPELNSER